MAIFDTSKTYFDIVDLRTQDFSLFDNAQILDWDDNVSFVSNISTSGSNNEVKPVDNSIKIVTETNGTITLGRKTYNEWSDMDLEKFLKSHIANKIGSTMTSTLLREILSNTAVKSNASFGDAMKLIDTRYWRRNAMKLILPIDSDNYDYGSGRYKGIDLIYSTYLASIATRTDVKEMGGIILNTDNIFVQQYPSNGLKLLEEESALNSYMKWSYRYKFKAGIIDSKSLVKFNMGN